jgi:hypothetical protein
MAKWEADKKAQKQMEVLKKKNYTLVFHPLALFTINYYLQNTELSTNNQHVATLKEQLARTQAEKYPSLCSLNNFILSIPEQPSNSYTTHSKLNKKRKHNNIPPCPLLLNMC